MGMCVCVCVVPNLFKSCTNCGVQILRPSAMRPNHEFLSSGAPSLAQRTRSMGPPRREARKHGHGMQDAVGTQTPPALVAHLPVSSTQSPVCVCVCVCVHI